jgi:hypothetical protein
MRTLQVIEVHRDLGRPRYSQNARDVCVGCADARYVQPVGPTR